METKALYTPELRFPEFSGDWGIANGNDLFETIVNKNHNSDLPILAITQDQGAVPREMIDYNISVTDASVASYKVVEIGDFIISLRSFQGGIEYSNYKGICSPAYIILRKKSDDVCNDFYKFFFKTKRYISELTKNLEGIRDGKMISYKQFSETKLPFPFLPEQRKIAACLSSLDNLIAQTRKKEDLLKQHKKGLILKLFPRNGSNVPELRFPEFSGNWEVKPLGFFLNEHKLKSTGKEVVYSVSVSKGLVNQIEHLGRSFAAADTSKYNLVKPYDIVYTKSPTGSFPYGIVKQSQVKENVIVSPLYGVFSPTNKYIGYIIHCYFESIIRTNNYLASLIKKGARNTIQITNNTFLSKNVLFPTEEGEQHKIADCLSSIDKAIEETENKIRLLEQHKKGLMQKMFVKM